MDSFWASTFLGRASVDKTECAYRRWLEAATCLGERLQENRPLLDAYLLCVLRLATHCQASACAEAGELALCKMRGEHADLPMLRRTFVCLNAESMAFLHTEEARLKTLAEWNAMQFLHERIRLLLGCEEPLLELLELFQQTFLILKPVDFFNRGFMENFMISLMDTAQSDEKSLLLEMLSVL